MTKTKYKIRLISCLAVVILALISMSLCACSGSSGDSVAGKYYAHVGGTKIETTYYELKADGKWQSHGEGMVNGIYSESSAHGTYKLTGGFIDLTVEPNFAVLKGTLSDDGVLTLNVGGETPVYRRDASDTVGRSFGDMALAAIFCLLMVFALLAVIYFLIKLTAVVIRQLETKFKKSDGVKTKKDGE